MKVKFEDGTSRVVKDDEIVECKEHNLKVRWGDLTGIQQLAVSAGLDVEGPVCIMAPNTGR